MRDRRLIAAAIVLVTVVALGLFGRREWRRSDELLQPVVVTADADVAALVHPSLRTRFDALFRRVRIPVAQREKLIALTFDDGPYPVETPLLLQTLRDLDVPATFFLIGRDAEQFPALARMIRAEGDEIADHTLTHPDLSKLGSDAVAAELHGGMAALERIAPDPSERTQFRPPHGRYTAGTLQTAQAAGFTTILWNDDPGDWRHVTAAALQAHVLRYATAPEILLLHSGRPATIAMLPEVVARYRRAGYTFVTVGALLRRAPVEHLDHPARNRLDPGV